MTVVSLPVTVVELSPSRSMYRSKVLLAQKHGGRGCLAVVDVWCSFVLESLDAPGHSSAGRALFPFWIDFSRHDDAILPRPFNTR